MGGELAAPTVYYVIVLYCPLLKFEGTLLLTTSVWIMEMTSDLDTVKIYLNEMFPENLVKIRRCDVT